MLLGLLTKLFGNLEAIFGSKVPCDVDILLLLNLILFDLKKFFFIDIHFSFVLKGN